jgi:hypothetical protein
MTSRQISARLASLSVLQAVNHLRLALRAEHRRAIVAFEFAHFIGQGGAAVQRHQKLLVDRVDQDAQFGKCFAHGGCLSVGPFKRLQVGAQSLHTG